MESTHNRRLLPVLFPALAALGIVLLLLFAAESAPTAAINLSVDRGAAQALGAALVSARGGQPASLWATTGYNLQGDAQSYLLDTVGREELEALASSDLNLASWQVRLFRPLNPEHWSVQISSRSGRVLGFDHIIPAEQPGATLPITAAQQLALQTLPVPPGELILVAQATQTQPVRTDHTFTWERPALARGAARYRYAVRIQGDQPGALREYYFLPDSWARDKAWHYRRSVLLSVIGWTFTYALTALIGFTWLLEARRGRLRWRWSLTLFLAVLVTGLLVALNSIALELATYDVNQSLGSFIFERGSNYLIQLGGLAATIGLAGAVGEALVWEQTAGTIHYGAMLTRRGLVSRPVVRALLIGGLVGVFQLGYVSAFYAIGGRFGVWSPVTALYDDTLSTPFPALYSLAIGLLPAVGEELVFRLGGISVLTRWLGRPRLAVVATAIIWAALHATYAQRPFFIRVLELALVGIMFGVLYLRYGVLASMAAHYTYNASLYVPLFWGGSLLYLASGVVTASAVALLLGPAVGRMIRRRALEPDQAVALALPEPAPWPKPVRIPAISLRAWHQPLAIGGVALLGLALIGWNLAPAQARPLTRNAALGLARQAGATLGFDTTELYPTVQASADWVDLDLGYLNDQLDRPAATRILQQHGHQRAWTVLWRGWDRTDDWQIELGPAGTVLAFERNLPEDAPGASIPISMAQSLALELLQRPRLAALLKVDLAGYELIDTATSKQTARTDHRFTWQTRQPVAAQAFQRLEVEIQGDQVSSVRPSLYTPPEYRREREQTTLLELLRDNSIALARDLGIAVLSLIGLFGVLRRRVPVKPWAWLGVGSGLLIAGLELLKISQGRWAEASWLALSSAYALNAGILQGGELALLAAGAATAWQWSYPRVPRLEDQLRAVLRGGRLRREGLILGSLLVPAGLLFLSARWWDGPRPGAFAPVSAVNSALPALELLGRMLVSATRTTLLLAGGAGLLQRLFGGRRLPAIALMTLAALGSAINLESSTHILVALLAWPLAVGVAYQLRGNLVALWLSLLSLLLLPASWALLSSGGGWLISQGIAVLIALIGGLLLLLRQRDSRRSEQQNAAL